ncbi:prolyl oligopeptidase family serine peptidase [Tichowtungia aerotolerans]|uniref:Prolyl oligopeptidase family serine peptidase n=1 Tax=Tichowtungia aerotolerans TaxID=2697043 RepID=A0A6P1MH15_9BACT|nr:prolyl oligopeptidase family serine peptidase [Tichowtungia aerotolerans]
MFVFHGHGGNMRNTFRKFAIQDQWPEAAVIYMQGLPTPGQLTDPEGKRNGWNCDPNDRINRDLKFFDAVYASLQDRIDTNRVYCTGHSNGGSFTYMLWGVRGDLFAAIAPSGALNPKVIGKIQPLPVLHIAGENDPLVKFSWQDKMMKVVQRVNGCSSQGEPWPSAGDLTGTLYPSSGGTPLVTLIHSGGHQFPSEAPELMVRFFKQHSRK